MRSIYSIDYEMAHSKKKKKQKITKRRRGPYGACTVFPNQNERRINMKNTKHMDIMILTGKEVIIVPCLAIIGAASIVGATGYGIYKLGKKVYDKFAIKDKVFAAKVEERVQEYYETL